MTFDIQDPAFIAASGGLPQVDFSIDVGQGGRVNGQLWQANVPTSCALHIYNPGTGPLVVTSVSLAYTIHVYGGGPGNDIDVTNYNFSGVIPPGGSVAIVIGITWHWDEDCSWNLTVNSNAKTVVHNQIHFDWLSW
jgi:hypothetical protein